MYLITESQLERRNQKRMDLQEYMELAECQSSRAETPEIPQSIGEVRAIIHLLEKANENKVFWQKAVPNKNRTQSDINLNLHFAGGAIGCLKYALKNGLEDMARKQESAKEANYLKKCYADELLAA